MTLALAGSLAVRLNPPRVLALPFTVLLQAVPRAEAEALATEFGISYFETSAKKGFGVEEAFRNVAEQVVKRLAQDGGGGARAGSGGGGAAAGAGKVDIGAAGGGEKKGGCCGK